MEDKKMIRKFSSTTLKSTIIVGLVFGLSIAWAVQIYSSSMTVKKGQRGGMRLVGDGNSFIDVYTDNGTLDAYIEEQGIDKVKITCHLIETLVERDDGSTYYHLTFVFGPHGAFFTPEPLWVKLKGKYFSDDTVILTYDENGEAVEGVRHRNGREIHFKIPHFSSYSYDHYDY